MSPGALRRRTVLLASCYLALLPGTPLFARYSGDSDPAASQGTDAANLDPLKASLENGRCSAAEISERRLLARLTPAGKAGSFEAGDWR